MTSLLTSLQIDLLLIESHFHHFSCDKKQSQAKFAGTHVLSWASCRKRWQTSSKNNAGSAACLLNGIFLAPKKIGYLFASFWKLPAILHSPKLHCLIFIQCMSFYKLKVIASRKWVHYHSLEACNCQPYQGLLWRMLYCNPQIWF